MLEERFRIMILSKDGTGLKQFSFNTKRLVLFSIIFSLLVVGTVALSLGLFTKVFHSYRIMALEHDRVKLYEDLLSMKERVYKLGVQFGEIEDHGEKLAITAGVDPIDTDTRKAGVGGATYYEALLATGFYSEKISRTSGEVTKDLDYLERIVRLEKANLSSISARLSRRDHDISHFPSIKPIVGGFITDGFGIRRDPYTGRRANHQGIDFPARKGTSVHAAADGVVERAKTLYTPNKNYGREIVINHGNGYKTRYAHLSKVNVYQGQTVKRWEIIGEVGQTGKATGDHLHYEVIFNQKRVDPENFIYN